MSALLAQTTYTYLPEQVGFWMIAILMVVAALRVVTTKNVVHAALWLVVVLAGVAAQFILLASEFVAVTQVLVYIGAIVVLFLFGIMLTRATIGTDPDTDYKNRFPALVVSLLLLGVMSYSVIEFFEDAELPREGVSSTYEVSDSIFRDYIVPFEATSVLLLAALIGAIVVARKE